MSELILFISLKIKISKSNALNFMKKKYSIGILGATGMVGQKYISLLKNHPWFEIKCLAASKNSAGKTYEEALKNRWVINEDIPQNLKNMIVLDAFNDAKKIASMVDFVFCAISLEKNETKIFEEMYAKLECVVISNNSANRTVKDIPMIIPELNAEHMKIIPYQRQRLGTKRGFIATKSNCSIQCFVPAIYALKQLGIKSVLACTYQAISGAGKTFETWPEMKDNIIPYISGEEEKTENEPLKIFGNISNKEIISSNKINITSQCVRVPVTNGHTAAVFASFEKKIQIDDILNMWYNFKGDERSLNLPSSPEKFITYFDENDQPQIFSKRNLYNGMGISIGRLRKDSIFDIKFISMSHNTVRGAAGGAILLAEMLCRENYI